MTVLIDSWAWIEYWKGSKYSSHAAKYIDGEEEAFVSAINITEIYSWITRYYNEKVAKEKVKTVEKRCYVMPVDKNVAIEAARLKIKHKLGIADSIVLSTANQINCEILTGDPDFEKIDRVRFIGGK